MKEEIKKALDNIQKICYDFRGTKQDHIFIEQCLELITKELNNCTCKKD